MKTVAKVFVSGKYFQDEASQTIGAPGIGPNAGQIFANRRLATGRLNSEGKAKLDALVSKLERDYNFKAHVRWDRFCGCSMCPCSPGFRILTDDPIKLEYEWKQHARPHRQPKLLFDGWIE